MQNKFGSGEKVSVVVPSGGCTTGVGLLIGSLFGIANTTQVAGDTVSLDTEGEFDHIAAGAGSGQAWAVGDTIYWDNTAKQMTKTSTSNTKVGYATAVKLTTDVVGKINLVPFVL
jgi:predicted RecA/RadA family phage recombinase